MMRNVGTGSQGDPDTAPTDVDGDAYRDLARLLPQVPSFSRILRRMMQEAQGRVVIPPAAPLTKKARRKANRERNLLAAVRYAA